MLVGRFQMTVRSPFSYSSPIHSLSPSMHVLSEQSILYSRRLEHEEMEVRRNAGGT